MAVCSCFQIDFWWQINGYYGQSYTQFSEKPLIDRKWRHGDMVPVELLYLAIQECIFMYILSFYAYVTMSNMKQETRMENCTPLGAKTSHEQLGDVIEHLAALWTRMFWFVAETNPETMSTKRTRLWPYYGHGNVTPLTHIFFYWNKHRMLVGLTKPTFTPKMVYKNDGHYESHVWRVGSCAWYSVGTWEGYKKWCLMETVHQFRERWVNDPSQNVGQ